MPEDNVSQPSATRLRRGLAAALLQPALRESFALDGAVPTVTGADEFRDFLVRDIDQNRKAIRVAGVQPE